MKICIDLVFDKNTGMITGFIDYGQQNLDQCFSATAEECFHGMVITVASHMLTMMVRGIFGFCICTVWNYRFELFYHACALS